MPTLIALPPSLACSTLTREGPAEGSRTSGIASTDQSLVPRVVTGHRR